MSDRPKRQPAAPPDLPKAPTTGHPARLPKHDGDPEQPNQAAGESVADSNDNEHRDQGKQEEQSMGATSGAAAAEEPLPMPPSKQKDVRQTWGTKLRPTTIERLNTFASAHNTHIQEVVEMALDEFMTRRGG